MITTPTSAALPSGIGWWNGMAAQLSLPSTLGLRPRRDARLRAGSRRYFLQDDLPEQLGIGGAEGERRRVHALPGQGDVARGIERGPGGARGIDPGGKPLCRHRLHVEMHARKTVAAVVARQA